MRTRSFSDQYKASQIVSQIPSRGTHVKLGQHIHVLVSLGPPRVKVPALVGETVRAAQITAVQRGLTVGNVATVHAPSSVADDIMAQDPPPAKTDVQSPAVNLLVSLGETPADFLCPNFVGRPLDEARRTLERAKFTIGQVTPVPTATAGVNTIMGQTPQAGTRIAPDTTFSFQVAAAAQATPAQSAAPTTSPPTAPK